MALAEQRALDLLEKSLATLPHLAEIEVTGKQHQSAAFHPTAAPADHVGQIIEIEPPLARLRERGVGRDVDGAMVFVVER